MSDKTDVDCYDTTACGGDCEDCTMEIAADESGKTIGEYRAENERLLERIATLVRQVKNRDKDIKVADAMINLNGEEYEDIKKKVSQRHYEYDSLTQRIWDQSEIIERLRAEKEELRHQVEDAQRCTELEGEFRDIEKDRLRAEKASLLEVCEKIVLMTDADLGYVQSRNEESIVEDFQDVVKVAQSAIAKAKEGDHE